MVLFFELKHSADDRVAAGTYITRIPENGKWNREEWLSEDKKVNYDPRFSNKNKTKYCYQMYLDFHRCTKKHGEGYEVCNYFLRHYQNLCPIPWVDEWDAQRAEGTFPGTI